jgi:hypothetical protein
MRETTHAHVDGKGRVQLAFTLPSGRRVTSTDWLVPGEIKGKVLIAWADAIRAEDSFDIQQREEREKVARVEQRARELSSSALQDSAANVQRSQLNELLSGSPSKGTGFAETSKALSTVLPDDPGELIHAKLSALRIDHEKEVRLRDECIARIATLEENIDRWSAVSSALRIEEPTHDDSPTTGSEGTILDLPSVGGGSAPRVRRTPRTQRQRRRAKGGADHGAGDGVQDSPDHVDCTPPTVPSGP